MDWLIEEFDVAHGIVVSGAFMLGTLLARIWPRFVAHRWARTFGSRCLIPALAPGLAGHPHDFGRNSAPLFDQRERLKLAEEFRHSLKGPVETIQTSFDLIQRAPAAQSEQAERAYSLIASSLARLRRLASEQHPGFAAPDGPERVAAPIDLEEAVGELASSYRPLLAARNIALDYRGCGRLLVGGTRLGIDVVIENILDNAIGFSPRGSTLLVRIERRGNEAELRIEDEGPGVDPALLDRIFERSFSHRPATGARGEGPENGPGHCGLGLWMVRQHVEALGGTVTASNRTAGGLCVRVRLPRFAPGRTGADPF